MKTPFYKPSKNEQLAASLGFSITHDGCMVFLPNGKIAKQTLNHNGYYIISFGPKKSRKKMLVSRFQCWFKFGEAIYQPNIVCRHLDGNQLNNHWDNLDIGTQSQNMMDRPAEVRFKHAFATSRYALKHDHVAIVAYYKIHGFKKTMVEFGLSSKGTLSFIINKTQTATPVLIEERPKPKRLLKNA